MISTPRRASQAYPVSSPISEMGTWCAIVRGVMVLRDIVFQGCGLCTRVWNACLRDHRGFRNVVRDHGSKNRPYSVGNKKKLGSWYDSCNK